MVWSYSKIDETKVKTIEEFEKKMNVTLLAFSEQNISNANLNDEELKELKELEKKLGLSLLAVKV